jgi:glycosyltransferase involved in cell wall biosynthesis
MEPEVSIIIPFYNCSYVDKAITSVLEQTHKDFEIIVVNDGSSLYADKLNPFLDRIRLIEKENGGTASALNAGIKAAKGKYFCWLSSDDYFTPDKLANQLQFMREKESLASFSSFYMVDANEQILDGPIILDIPDRLALYKRLRGNCPVNGCTVMLHMEIFKKIGYFDESLLYTQDYDFWLRLVKHYDFHYYTRPLLYYRMHDEMGTRKHAGEIRREFRTVRQKHRDSMNQLIKTELLRLEALSDS